LSRVDWKIDRNNRRSDFSYDINDNLLTEQWNNTTQLTFTYDKVGKLKSSYDATSNTTNVYNRDASYYWSELVTLHPEAFSQRNLDILAGKIKVRGKDGTLKTLSSPKNDSVFYNYFEQYNVTGMRANTLIHHHIGGGGQAFAVPSSIHPGSGGIHNIEKDLGIWDKDKNISDILQKFVDKFNSNM
jgi:YD repeat-containing protein